MECGRRERGRGERWEKEREKVTIPHIMRVWLCMTSNEVLYMWNELSLTHKPWHKFTYPLLLP